MSYRQILDGQVKSKVNHSNSITLEPHLENRLNEHDYNSILNYKK